MATRPRLNGELDSVGTLLAAEPINGSQRALKGKARGVLAVAIGILLCTMSSAGSSDKAVNKTYIDYKTYALYLLDFNYEQYKCLTILYGKESAWNPDAVNGSHHGIPQGRSEYLATLDGYGQVRWGLDYIGHRYGEPCIALDHWRLKGWH
jgi:hypothetical protein